MHDILSRIIAHKREEVRSAKSKHPPESLSKRPFPVLRDFESALRNPGLSVIAEVKRKSPSAGIIQPDFDPVQIARHYEKAGANAVSVLTDTEFFGGRLDYLEEIKNSISLPLLRKDFIIDSYQITEARAAGADAVLLIVAALDALQLDEYIAETEALGMAALVEVHTAAETETALSSGARIIGINNRDLNTFKVNLETSLALKRLLPDCVLTVSESGIKTGADTEILKNGGFDAVLIGETLMKEKNPAARIREFRGEL